MPFFGPVSAGGIGKATVTATTGSPTIDSSTRAGKTIYKFTGSGSITIGTAGTCEVLLIGGGGGAAFGGGGAGGYYYDTNAFIPSGTLTVTVGAGGTGRTSGGTYNGIAGAKSLISSTPLIAVGGGGGAYNPNPGNNGSAGGSGGGGAGGNNQQTGSYAGGIGWQGNNGGPGWNLSLIHI